MKPALRSIATIHRAEQISGDLFDDVMKNEGLTPRQAQVLFAIASASGQCQAEIVNETDIDRSTLSDICRRLKKKGLITQRRTQDDQRAYSLAMTDAGKALLKRVEKSLDKLDQVMRQRISGLDHLRIVEPVREAAE